MRLLWRGLTYRLCSWGNAVPLPYRVRAESATDRSRPAGQTNQLRTDLGGSLTFPSGRRKEYRLRWIGGRCGWRGGDAEATQRDDRLGALELGDGLCR